MDRVVSNISRQQFRQTLLDEMHEQIPYPLAQSFSHLVARGGRATSKENELIPVSSGRQSITSEPNVLQHHQ